MLGRTLIGLLLAVSCAGSLGTSVEARQTVELSDVVSILSPDGSELAQIQVTELADPFEAYDPNDPPIRGYHYVVLGARVANTGSQPFTITPGDFALLDTDGFLYAQTEVRQLDASQAPALEHQDLAPGAEAIGLVGFQVLNDVTAAELLYFGDNGFLATIDTYRDEHAPATGEGFEVAGPDGAAAMKITVNSFTDPFTGFSEGSNPDRGSRYVLLDLRIENVSPRPLPVSPGKMYVQDTDGFLHVSTTVRRDDTSTKPELEHGDIDALAVAEGAVGFQLPAGVEVRRVLYQPAGDRLIVLLAPGTARSADAGSQGSANGAPSSPPAATSNGDCDAINQWLSFVLTESNAAVGLIGQLMVMRSDNDPTYAEQAHAVAAAMNGFADQLTRATTLPSDVAAINQRLIDGMRAYAAALDDLATAVESGDQAVQDKAGQALYDAEPALITAQGEVSDLGATCNVTG